MAVGKSLRFLLADQDASFRSGLADLLAKAGHAVQEAPEGPDQAWAVLRQGGVDVVLMDWPAASANDFALLRKMAALPTTARTARIVAVAEPDAAAARQAGDRLSCPMLAKEALPKGLKDAVKQALAQARKPKAGQTVRPGEDAAKFFTQGLDQLKAKDFDAAILNFSRALKQRKVFPEACKGLGLAFAGQGVEDRALHFLNKALEQYRVLGRTESAAKLEKHILAHHGPGSAQPAPGGDPAAPETPPPPQGRDVPDEPLPASPPSQELDMHDTLVNLDDVLGGVAQEDAESLNVEVGGEDWYARASEEVRNEHETILDSEGDDDADKKGRERRKHCRVPLVENFVRLHKHKELLPAVDICIEGIGFKDQGKPFASGDILVLDVLSMGEEVLMKKVEVQVRHVTKGQVGCRFEEMSSRNRKALEKLLGW